MEKVCCLLYLIDGSIKIYFIGGVYHSGTSYQFYNLLDTFSSSYSNGGESILSGQTIVTNGSQTAFNTLYKNSCCGDLPHLARSFGHETCPYFYTYSFYFVSRDIVCRRDKGELIGAKMGKFCGRQIARACGPFRLV